MAVPFVALAALAGAVLSEELGDEAPRWKVEVDDDAFDRVDDVHFRGYLVIDFLLRTVRGIAWRTSFPAERTDWVFQVPRLVGSDVRSWVEEQLEWLEASRPAVLAGGADQDREGFADRLDRSTWGRLRVLQSPGEVLHNLSENWGDRHVFEKLEEGVRHFFSNDLHGTAVSGTPEQQAEAVLDWAKEQVQEALGSDGRVVDLPEEELALLRVVGAAVGGFDVVLNDPALVEWHEDDSSRYQLQPTFRSDQLEALRWVLRP